MIKHVIINPESGSKIILRNIAQESSWKGNPLFYEEADGNNIYYGDSSILKITSYDFSHYRSLVQLMKNRIKVKVIVVGMSESLVWSDYMTFIIAQKQRNKPGTKNTITLTFQMKESAHNIFKGDVPYYLVTRTGDYIVTRAGAQIKINGEKAYESN